MDISSTTSSQYIQPPENKSYAVWVALHPITTLALSIIVYYGTSIAAATLTLRHPITIIISTVICYKVITHLFTWETDEIDSESTTATEMLSVSERRVSFTAPIEEVQASAVTESGLSLHAQQQQRQYFGLTKVFSWLQNHLPIGTGRVEQTPRTNTTGTLVPLADVLEHPSDSPRSSNTVVISSASSDTSSAVMVSIPDSSNS